MTVMLDSVRTRMAGAPVRVLVCDDSVVVRSAIANILEAHEDIEVVARVGNGRAAVDAVKRTSIDVVVLDIEMPIMDGLTALPLLLAQSPKLRVIMASSLTTRGAEIAFRALRMGAADTLAKPSAFSLKGDQSFAPELVAKVLGLARISRSESDAGGETAAQTFALRPAGIKAPRLLAIGSSTGGPNALFSLVQQIGPRFALPIVLTQHMPASFTPMLAQQLDRLGLPCSQAKDGDRLVPGQMLLAPGDRHLIINRDSTGMTAHLSDGPPENFCRPSVDPMLRSACEAADGRVLAVILTGMGHDGLQGSRQVVQAGGSVIAQDEATSVVWGMPGAVTRAGLAHAILPLPKIGPKLASMLLECRA